MVLILKNTENPEKEFILFKAKVETVCCSVGVGGVEI